MCKLNTNQKPKFRCFADWCLCKDNLSREMRLTVEELLRQSGTLDCYEAEKILANFTALILQAKQNFNLVPLSTLTNLKTLYLINLEVSDFTPLSALRNLQELHLVSISNINQMPALPNLKQLNISRCTISDVSSWFKLVNLKQLNISQCTISDLSPLSRLTNLEILYLNNSKITDISPIANLTQLTKLHLNDNKISDLSPLYRLINLKQLELSNNNITKIIPLFLNNLRSLDLSHNRISDLNGISSLSKLISLKISSNKISDLSPLFSLTHLSKLDISGNDIDQPISSVYRLKSLTALNINLKTKVVGISGVSLLQKKWLKLFTIPINHQKAIAAVKLAYEMIGYKEPKIVFCPSPNAGRIELDKCDNLGKPLAVKLCQFPNNFPEELPINLALVYLLRQPIHNAIKTVHHICKSIEYQGKDIFEDEFSNLGGNPIFAPQTEISLMPQDLIAIIGFKKLLASELGVALEQQEQVALQYLQQLLENCDWIYPFEKVCVVCEHPYKLNLDTENQLHSDLEAAIQFADGSHTRYYYHGVKWPEN